MKLLDFAKKVKNKGIIKSFSIFLMLIFFTLENVLTRTSIRARIYKNKK